MSGLLTPLRALLAALVLALLAAIALALRTPRLTLANDALTIAYPLHAAAVPALSVLGLAALAFARRAGGTRVLAAVLAMGLLLAIADGLRFGVSADARGLVVGRLFASERVAWNQLERVESPQGTLVLTTSGGRRLVVGDRALSLDLRSVLGRTIARRLRESAEAPPADGTPGAAPTR